MDALTVPGAVYLFHGFRLDTVSRTLSRDGAAIVLQGRQFDTLAYLLAHAGRVVPRAELFAAIWPGRIVEDNNLAQAISGLRKALGDDTLIVTVKSRGYRIGVPVWPETPAPAPPMQRRRWQAPAALAALCILALIAWRRAHPSFAPPAHSVAVLPFTNLSGDPAQDYVATGLAEDLTDRLGRIGTLRVAATLSAAAARHHAASAGDIGRALNVGALIDGSVRRDGDHVSVIARLVDVATGYQIWSGRYDSARPDMLAMEIDIAGHVARSLQTGLTAPQSARLGLGGTTSPAAYDDYLRGIQSLRQGGDSALHSAIGHFTDAIGRDPAYAMAYLQRGRAREDLTETESGTDLAALHAGQDAAEQDTARALALAPDLGAAHIQNGRLALENHFDFTAAAIALDQGRALAPADARAELDAAMLQTYVGQTAQAVAGAREAAELDPLTPQTQRDLAAVLFQARDYPAAGLALDRAMALEPAETTDDRALRCALALAQGHPDAVPQLCTDDRDWPQHVLLAVARQALGQHDLAAQELAVLRAALAGTGAVQYAEIYAQWGRTADAIAALKDALAARDPGLIGLGTDPLLDPLRGNPAFQAIARHIGLP